MRLAPFCLLLSTFAACKGGGGGADDTDPDTDSDTTSTYEEGCITVDGAGGYAWLADALTVAGDGATIALCEGAITESITVDKNVTIVGAGLDKTEWTAATNEAALTVGEGVTVALSGVEIISTRSGVVVTGGSVAISDVHFSNVDNYAVDATDATVTLTGVVMDDPDGRGTWGGVRASDSTVEVTASTFTGVAGFPVSVDGGTATVTDSTFTATACSKRSCDDLDGFAIHGNEFATVVTSGNTYSENELGDVYVAGASTLTSTGDTSSMANVYAVLALTAEVSITDARIEDYLQYAVWSEGGQPITLTNTVISTTHEGSAEQDGADTLDVSGSFGVIVVDGDLTLDTVTVSGNNGGGVLAVTSSDTADATVTAVDSVIDDNARMGILGYYADVFITNTTVSNTLDDDATCTDSVNGYIFCNMAVSTWFADLTVSGGTFANNGDYGLIPIQGTFELTGATVRENTGYGAWCYESACTVDTVTFEGSKEYGFVATSATVLIDNSTFTGASNVYESTWTDSDGVVWDYYSYNAGQDAYFYDGDVTIRNSTFGDGDSGIVLSSTDAEISDSTFSGYNGYAMQVSYATVLLDNVDFSNTGTQAISCYGYSSSPATLEIDGVSITDTTLYKYKYEQFMDGELYWSYEGTSPGVAFYSYGCDLAVDDLTIDGVHGSAMTLYDGAIDLDGVEIRNAVTDGYSWDAGLEFSVSSSAPNVTIADLDVVGVGNGYALAFTGSSTYTGGTVTLTDIGIGSTDTGGEITGIGLYVSSIDALTVTDLDITATTDDGVYLYDTTATIIGDSGAGARTGTIVGAGDYGLYANASDVTATDLVIDASVGSGMYFSAGTHSITGNVVTGAGEYGMECVSSPTFTACENDVSGTLGDIQDCTGCTDTSSGS